MIIRTDHVAGAAFVLFGLIAFALSGNLPFGSLSFPGAGFMPKLVIVLMIAFGILLFLRAGESEPFTQIDWSERNHTGLVILITACGIVAYTALGFIITVALLIFALLVAVERKNVVNALAYCVGVTAAIYVVFEYGLKIQLPDGPFRF